MRYDSIGGVHVQVGAQWEEVPFQLSFKTITKCVSVHPDHFVAEVSLNGVVLMRSEPLSDKRAAAVAAHATLTRRLAQVLKEPTDADDQ